MTHFDNTELNSLSSLNISSTSSFFSLSSYFNLNTIGFSKFNPFRGGSYIKLPDFIKNKKAVLNIENNDNKCHMW